MNTVLLRRDGVAIVECTGGLAKIDDALELISACMEHGANGVLIEARALPPDFFALKTRFAGELLQKLANYGVRLAGVFPPDAEYAERFREFLAEARRGRGFRAFDTRAEAEAWLALS